MVLLLLVHLNLMLQKLLLFQQGLQLKVSIGCVNSSRRLLQGRLLSNLIDELGSFTTVKSR